MTKAEWDTAMVALTGFQVTPTKVPRTGLTSLAVTQQVTDIAVSFFNRVLEAITAEGNWTAARHESRRAFVGVGT